MFLIIGTLYAATGKFLFMTFLSGNNCTELLDLIMWLNLIVPINVLQNRTLQILFGTFIRLNDDDDDIDDDMIRL